MSIAFVRDSLAQCGVPLPATAQQATEALAALQAEAARDVVTEALEAAAASPLTAKNAGKRVQDLAAALIARDRATEAARHFEPAVLQTFRQDIVANIDALIAAMRPTFEAAAAVVHQAGAMFDPSNPPTTDAGLDVLAVYQQLDDAQARLSAVRAARVSICEMAGYAKADVTWFIAGAKNADDLHAARIHYKAGWHRLARAGYELRLNLPSEAAAIEADAAAGSAAIAEAARLARIEKNRDPLRDAAFKEVGV